MTTCLECGADNRAEARFCDSCGAALAEARPAREQRKTVTVLFCDVTASTELGESADPEALRALLARYFERMKGIIESHGGTVEKFIGDAVMAVFGVPQVHEDDALRACRAAVEMRDALPDLGVEARIGLNTGEVVTGTEERLATGDTVNVAARLEQAAQPGQILVGAETLRLVREAVEAEPVEPLELKGKSEPVPAFRLVELTTEPKRRHEAPMVGRERELDRLRDAFEHAVANRSCQLFTVLGTAGVGKSRLAAEFLSGLEATVIRGRCLSYGEGITYWPIVEVVKQLSAEPSDPAAAAALRSLLGESEVAASADEIAWALRRLLEERARESPLVVVFDDVHWGEETFLELVEHVAGLSRDAPLVLLCMARPELLDRRPGWGGGQLNATTVLLEPLDAAETDALLNALGGDFDPDLRERIRDAAEGNPLFVEEMLALVRESGRADVEVPPTIQALLAARIDQLDPAERSVLERGSVEGRVFHQGAVQALSNGDAPAVGAKLVALVRKELVRPDRSQLPGDDAYRFRHLLIRDAAYDALPKTTRAELHERFAAWLEERGGELVELDEIVGHHLEQAVRYRRELGRDDTGLAERAGRRLAEAANRASARSDHRAETLLLERALDLLLPLGSQVDLEVRLAGLYARSLDMARASETAEAAAERARAESDDAGEAAARVVAAQARALVAVDADYDEVEALAERALGLLRASGRDGLLVHVWLALSQVAGYRGDSGTCADAIEQALRHANEAGTAAPNLFGLGSALVLGPRPATDGLRVLEELAPAPRSPYIEVHRARLLAMLGRFDEARRLAEAVARQMDELAGNTNAGDLVLFEIAEFEGDFVTAERLLQRVCSFYEARELWPYLSTYIGILGRIEYELGRIEEAALLAERSRELGAPDDVSTEEVWRQVKARVLAARGEYEEAERLAREAVAIAERTDQLVNQGGCLADLGEVVAAAAREDEAIELLEQALDRFERKQALPLAARVRRRLEELRQAARA